MSTRVRCLARLPLASGAELAGLLERLTVDLDELTDAERLEIVKATARLEAWTTAVRAGAINAVFESVSAELTGEAAEPAVPAAESSPRRGPGGRTVAGPSHGFDDERLLHRRVATEVSLVLGVSPRMADREVDLARDLAAHPPLRRGLAAGVLDRTQVSVICQGLHALTSADPERDRVLRGRLVARLLGPDDSADGDEWDPDEPASDVDDHGQPVGTIRELADPRSTLWALVPGRLKGILAREAIRLDPGAAAQAAERARDDRWVAFDPQPSFMAELHLRTSTDAAAAIWTNLDQAARAARQAGDPRNLDQLRADIATGWLTEGAYGTLVTRPPENESRSARPRGPLVHLTVAATTMLGLDHEPATLHGPSGPIPVPDEVARRLAHRGDARWRRLLYDPATGVATDLSRHYHPPDPMADFVQARDGHTTRHPTSCATHLELDHVHAFDHARPARGGATTPANLASSGQRDHQLKTDGALRVTGDANHELTISTPSGRSYLSLPAVHADVGPPPF